MNFLGFRLRAGAWCRGSQAIEEALVDDLDEETFAQYVCYWRRTRPKGERMAQQHSAVMERLTSPRQLSSLDSETGWFKGYASVWGSVVDSYMPTVIQQGSFRDSLARRPHVPVLWSHAAENPIAMTKVLREDGTGLYVEAQMIMEDPQVRGYWARVKSGAARGLSIGFQPGPAEIRGNPPTRYLSSVDLLELSICVFPADSQAYIRDVQAHDPRSPATRLAEAEIVMAETSLRQPQRPVLLPARTLDLSVDMEREDRPTWQRQLQRVQLRAQEEGRLLPNGQILGAGPYEAMLLMKQVSMEAYEQRELERQRAERNGKIMHAIASQCIRH